MFCAEDIGRSLQRFCWPPPTGTTAVLAANFVDQRNVLPSVMIPSIALQPPSTCFVLPPLPPLQQLPVNFSPAAISPPFQQRLHGNFAAYPNSAAAAVTVDCNSVVRPPNGRFHQPHREVDNELSVPYGADQRRRRPAAEIIEPLVNGKGDTGNGSRTAGVRRRSQATTSFTIADILEGRIGNGEGGSKRRRVHQSPSVDGSSPVCDKGGCSRLDEPAIPTGCRLPSGPELVRPWNKSDLMTSDPSTGRSEDSGSRRSSASSMSAASPDANDDDYEDDDDMDNDDDDEDVDVDDAGLTNKRQASGAQSGTSSSTVCPLGALLRMASQTNFDASPGSGLQDCLATFDGKHSTCRQFIVVNL